MSDNPLSPLDPVELALALTPARVLVGRAGPAYHTSTALKLREDHAAARDAVLTEVDVHRDFGEQVEEFGLFQVQTQAASKIDYLRRPDLGRKLTADSRDIIKANCLANVDLQVVVGDGLSATAASVQGPGLLRRLRTLSRVRSWTFGRPFLVRYCRVGVMNDIGDLLAPTIVVLLIGERPGLATAESLSAYLAYRPRTGHTDANRNLISNIHARGIGLDDAAQRIVALADQLRKAGRSGVGVTEVFTADRAIEQSPRVEIPDTQ